MDENMKKEMQDILSEAFKGLEGKFVTAQKVTETLEAVKTELTKKFDGVATKEDIDKALESYAEKAIVDVQKMIDKTKVGEKIKSFGDVFAKEFDAEKFLADGKGASSSFQIKVDEGFATKTAATIVVANAGSGGHTTTYEVEAGVSEAPREANAVLPLLMKGNTSSRTIFWINRVNKDGGAAFIAEGAVKPLMDWDYVEASSVAKKVGVMAKFSREALKDVVALKSDINYMLTQDLMEEIEDSLLNGAGGTALTGITTVAGGYVSTALDDLVVTPNNADAIRAAILQMRLLKFKPNVVWINPAEGAIMDLTKSSTGNYIKIELDGVLRQILVKETTNISAGKFLLMDTSKYKVKMLEDITLEFGYENDDFTKGLVTATAEARLHAYYNAIDAGSMMYGDFATVKAAIAKP